MSEWTQGTVLIQWDPSQPLSEIQRVLPRIRDLWPGASVRPWDISHDGVTHLGFERSATISDVVLTLCRVVQDYSSHFHRVHVLVDTPADRVDILWSPDQGFEYSITDPATETPAYHPIPVRLDARMEYVVSPGWGLDHWFEHRGANTPTKE